jgi:hypothetical protein
MMLDFVPLTDACYKQDFIPTSTSTNPDAPEINLLKVHLDGFNGAVVFNVCVPSLSAAAFVKSTEHSEVQFVVRGEVEASQLLYELENIARELRAKGVKPLSEHRTRLRSDDIFDRVR